MTAAARPERPPILVSLQILRGAAALMVVFYHVHIIGSDPRYLGRPLLAPLFEPGKFGVNLFFILSGFIICFAHRRDLGDAAALPRYMWRRFIRIYPLYWLCSALFVAAAVAGLGDADFSWDGGNLLSALLLVDIEREVTLPLRVAWTLFYEMKFYLLFASYLIDRRLGHAVMLAWGLYIGAAYLAGFNDRFNFAAMWNVHFLIGCGVFVLRDRVTSAAAPWLIALGAAGLVHAGLATDFALTPLEGGNDEVMLVLAIALGALVAGCIALEDVFARHAPPFARLIGDASYSIYLVHSAMLSLFFILCRKLGVAAMMPVWLGYLLGAVVAVGGGLLVYLLAERPLLRLLRRRRRGVAPLLVPARVSS